MSIHQRRSKKLPELDPSRQVAPIVDYLLISGTGGEQWGTERLWVGNPDARAPAFSEIMHGVGGIEIIACCPVWVEIVMTIVIIQERVLLNSGSSLI